MRRTVTFVGGGSGVAIGPGDRDNVTAVHKRASLTAGDVTVTGSNSGLAASESDITIGHFTATLGNDPNVTDANLNQARLGLGARRGRA
jgi:hypothetical protein